jgi:hypothetical protein
MKTSEKKLRKPTKKISHKNNENSFRQKDEYKRLSLFLVGTIGFLLLTYVGFALIMTSIKTEKLLQNQKLINSLPPDVGSLKSDIVNKGDTSMMQDEKVDVIVKEIFGEISSINGDVLTVNAQIYGDDKKNVRLKFQNKEEMVISSYIVDEKGQEVKTEMEIAELKEGMYIGVALPVEILLSEIEKDLIYIDNIIVEIDYKNEDNE